MKYSEYFRPARIALLIGLGVFILGGVLWRLGLFQESELWIYDCMVWCHADAKATDSRIMLVMLNEKDIESMDWPLRDTALSALLEKIEAGKPSVIGLDLYRDLPEPRDGSGSATLDQTFVRYPNIVPIFLFGDDTKAFQVPPPKVFVSGPNADTSANPTLYAFNNLPDVKVIRRGFLSLPNDLKYTSFPFLLAQYYLAVQKNIQASMDKQTIHLGKVAFNRLEGNDGGYVNESYAGYQFLLDYSGPLNFKTVSVSDVLKLQDPSIFTDKVVLIGISADSSNDTFSTPLSIGQLAFHRISNHLPDTVLEREPGVLLHAQIVNQLLRAALDGDRPTVGVGKNLEWAWIAFWCLLGIFVGFLVRSHIVFALTIVSCLGLITYSSWMLFVHGYWIIGFTPAIVFLATAMLVKAYAATYEQQQRANLMKLFSQRVPPAIAEEIWDKRDTFLQGGRPAAQRLTVTVLFTDLKNYSTISEGMSPAELIAWVNECQGALTRHVEKNRGMVFCFMGDGMMAVYGAPIPRTKEKDMAEDALNAVQSAIGMANEIRQMNAEWKAQGRPVAGLRVGIFTGEAMGGDLGSNEYLEYSVIGDTVNTASRLESVDKEGTMTGGEEECRILIGAMTYRFIKDKFAARHVGTINLKGKYQTTDVYQVAIDGTFRPIAPVETKATETKAQA
jgi:adenylate cyclase